MTRGKFLSIEGGEGVGKSTQIAALAAALREMGHDVVLTREPGGTEGAEVIRQLLLSGSEGRWTARTEALLFAAARADHVSRLIKPAMESGKWVISDRFLDSSRAYQSGGSGLSDDDIMALHHVGSEGFLPDRTLILQLAEAEATNRAAQRDGDQSDRIGGRDSSYHQLVHQAFQSYAKQDPSRVRLIDASGDVREVTGRLLHEISDLI
jgi:dTMP kinase